MANRISVPSAAQIARLNNISGPGDQAVNLGKFVNNAIGERFMYDTLDSYPVCMTKAVASSEPTGTGGDENVCYTGKNILEYHMIGTQTLVAPAWGATGLDFALDQTNTDGVEVCQGITARSKGAFVVGTDAFYARCKFLVTTVAGTDDCAFGFRKAEAYQAAIDDYDEMAAVNVIAGDIKLETILNDGATTTTDTTDDLADGEYLDVIIKVDINGHVTYSYDINGAGFAAPTTTAAFQFDSAEVVVPFFYQVQNATTTGSLPIQHWEFGLLGSAA